MRPKGSPQDLEARRRKALSLLKQGLRVTEVARKVGSSHSSVIRWRYLAAQGGEEALVAQPHPHRPCRMSVEEKQKLQELLLQGSEAHGYRDQLWTLPRIARVIEERFGITYHPAHVWKILHALGWSCQKPQRRAKEQDTQRVQEWRKKDWPRIKRLARKGKKIHSYS